MQKPIDSGNGASLQLEGHIYNALIPALELNLDRIPPKSKAFSIFKLLNAPDSNVVAAEGLEPPTRGL